MQAFGRGDLTERGNLEDFRRRWEIILKYIFKKWNGKAWT
jgi:hypothetical protein